MQLSIKHRPLILSDVIGHTKVIGELLKRSKKNDFPQTMLLAGGTGVGKTTIGRIIAKSILCENRDGEGNPCNDCSNCKAINQETFIINYQEFNASNLGVDDMRKIEDMSRKKSIGLAVSSIKIFYIDELQELSRNRQAQKNILKVLEKPAKDSYFILGTMNISKVDKAIQNRSIVYKLFSLDMENIADYLVKILIKEKVVENIEEISKEMADTIMTISENCEGSLRTALSLLERAIYSELWNEKDLVKELGIISSETISVIVNKILQGDISIFNVEINEDVLKQINYKLNLVYKNLNGLEFSQWQKSEISGIKKVDKEIVNFTIEKLNDLLRYIYLTKNLIEFTLINIINGNKKSIKLEEKILNGIPRRRRK